MNKDNPVNENNVKSTYFFHLTVHVSWMGSIKTEKIAIFAVILISITLLLLSHVLSIPLNSINIKLYDQIMHKIYKFQRACILFLATV